MGEFSYHAMQDVMGINDVNALSPTIPWPRLRLWQIHGASLFIPESNDTLLPGYSRIPKFIKILIACGLAAKIGVPPEVI